MTDDGRPLCPVCDAHGIETVTSDDETAMIEVDAGLTEPLRGVPCEECASQEAS